MKKTANILLHHSPYYRIHVFSEGLKKHGFRIINDRQYHPTENDVLLIWNRSNSHETIAKRYELAGATVIVAENGYIGKTRALAKFHHAGAGTWNVGEEDRWQRLKVPLHPWQQNEDGHILVLPQRSIGEIGVAMPRNWEMAVVKRLKVLTKRKIVVRKHPGKNQTIPLEADLEGAWASVTWASGAGIKSIIAGIPVFHDLRDWIGAPAASCTWDLEQPYKPDRLPMLRRLAWAQWTWEEIEQGEAFRWLL